MLHDTADEGVPGLVKMSRLLITDASACAYAALVHSFGPGSEADTAVGFNAASPDSMSMLSGSTVKVRIRNALLHRYDALNHDASSEFSLKKRQDRFSKLYMSNAFCPL